MACCADYRTVLDFGQGNKINLITSWTETNQRQRQVTMSFNKEIKDY